MKKVISVRFKENGKSYYFDPAGADIKTGEYVIVETARGIECGEVVQGVKEIADAAVPKALKPITRMADSVDIRRMRQIVNDLQWQMLDIGCIHIGPSLYANGFSVTVGKYVRDTFRAAVYGSPCVLAGNPCVIVAHGVITHGTAQQRLKGRLFSSGENVR